MHVRSLIFRSIAPLLAFLIQPPLSSAQQPPPREQTDTEILYRGRYTNCDAAYSVILPAGFVAHRDRSTAVNRGFRVDLSAPQDPRPMSHAAPRYLSVSNEYNSTELRSLTDIVNDALRRESDAKADFDVVEQLPVRLAGMAAAHFRARFKNREGRLIPEKMVEEGIIAFRPEEHGRGNLIYQLQLVSKENTYADDKRILDQITAGFRLQNFGSPGCE